MPEGRQAQTGVWKSAIPAPVNSAETWPIIVEIFISVDLIWNYLRGSSGVSLSTCLTLSEPGCLANVPIKPDSHIS